MGQFVYFVRGGRELGPGRRAVEMEYIVAPIWVLELPTIPDRTSDNPRHPQDTQRTVGGRTQLDGYDPGLKAGCFHKLPVILLVSSSFATLACCLSCSTAR